MQEIWKEIKGTKVRYEVSNFGNVRSFSKFKKGGLLKPNLDKDGYNIVGLVYPNKLKSLKVHRLVALAFIPRIKGKEFVNHKDFDKQNNHIDNLEWTTTQENTKHAYSLMPRGETHGESILTNKIVLEIREKRKKGASYRSLAEECNVTYQCVWQAINKRSWKHVTFQDS